MRTALRALGGFLVWVEPYLVIAVPLSILALCLAATGPVMGRVVVDSLIKLTVAIGLWVFVGNSGVISFGHAAFMIVAGYGSAWLTIPARMKMLILPDLPLLLKSTELHTGTALTVAVSASAALALLVGAVLVRLTGVGASIATFAFFGMVSTIYGNWTTWTKGTASLVGMPVYVTPAVAVALSMAAMLAAHSYSRTKRGLLLRATRENEAAAAASGISVYRERLIAFVFSAALVAVGGVMNAHFVGALTTTNNTFLNFQFIVLSMLVVGGIRSLSGTVIGVVLLSFVSEALRQLESGRSFWFFHVELPPGSREVGLGLLMLAILVHRKSGIMGDAEISLVGAWQSLRNRRSRGEPNPMSTPDDGGEVCPRLNPP